MMFVFQQSDYYGNKNIIVTIGLQSGGQRPYYYRVWGQSPWAIVTKHIIVTLHSGAEVAAFLAPSLPKPPAAWHHSHLFVNLYLFFNLLPQGLCPQTL